MKTPHLQCKFPPCLFTTSTSYSLSKHELRCKYRDKSPSSSILRERERPNTDGDETLPSIHDGFSLEEPPLPASPPPDHSPPRPPSPRSSPPRSLTEARTNYLIRALAVSFTELERKVGASAINEVISILKDPAFSLTKFDSTIRSTSECRSLTSSLVDHQLAHEGFSTFPISDDAGTSSGTVYLRDPVELLQKQLSLANNGNILYFPCPPKTTHDGTEIFTHPLETPSARAVHHFVRQKTMGSLHDEVMWNDTGSGGPQSFVGFLQMYTDKSSTTLKTSAVVAYPVHVTLLNFSSQFRNHCINIGDTIVGFLPVDVSPSIEDRTLDEMPATSSSSSRYDRMNVLHKAMNHILAPLYDVTQTGFLCTDKQGTQRRCFPILYNYCADLIEGKDISAILSGTITKLPCHRCYIPCEELSSSQQYPPRKIEDTESARRESGRLRDAAKQHARGNRPKRYRLAIQGSKEIVANISLYKVPSFLENCPLLPRGAPVDMYSVFSFEPLHNFFLGISRLIKMCAAQRLNSEDLMTTKGTKSGRSRTFKAARKGILAGANAILAGIERDYYTPGLHVDFSKGDKGQYLNGIYTDEGLRGMLEGKDYRSLDMVFPFIGAFMDRCCDEVESAPITSIFTQYTDIQHWAMRYGLAQEWTVAETEKLHSTVSQFKQQVTDVFAEHHASGLKTCKFHLLNHLAEDIRSMGSLKHCDAGVFEHSHLLFKQSYRQTSKRRSTVMRETIRRMEENRNLEAARVSLANPSDGSLSTRSIRPEDGAVLVRDGKRVCLLDFKEICTAAAPLVKDVEGQPRRTLLEPLRSSHSEEGIELFLQLGDQAATIFVKLVEEELQKLGSMAHPLHVRLNMVKSAYVMGGYTPTLDDFDRETKSLRYQPVDRHMLQRIFSTNSFGASRKPLFSHIMVSASTSDGHNSLWVGKALALIRLTASDVAGEHSYTFVQFMDCIMPQDEVDEVLGCVCLRWSSDDDVDHTLSPVALNEMQGSNHVVTVAPWYGLVKASSVMGTIHVVRQNFPAHPFVYPLNWMYHRFYINRFYKDHSKEFITFNDEGVEEW